MNFQSPQSTRNKGGRQKLQTKPRSTGLRRDWLGWKKGHEKEYNKKKEKKIRFNLSDISITILTSPDIELN